jgi:hypothetical protein
MGDMNNFLKDKLQCLNVQNIGKDGFTLVSIQEVNQMEDEAQAKQHIMYNLIPQPDSSFNLNENLEMYKALIKSITI